MSAASLIEAPEFGRIVVKGREYSRDVVVCKDLVFSRAKELSSEKKSIYGHTPLTLREVKEYLSKCGAIEEVVIAAGYYGDLPIEPDALSYLVKRCSKVVIIKTADLPKLSIDFSKAMVLIHVTC